MPTFVEIEFVERMNEEEGAEGQEAQPSMVPQDFFTSSPQYTLAQDTVYFCDGVRQIDFILVFDDEVHYQDAINNQRKRTEYQASLMKMGLDLEIEPKEPPSGGKCCKRNPGESELSIKDVSGWSHLSGQCNGHVIQFGFVTLFVASFPLAPLLALLNNIIEVRVDAWKLVTKMRRPVVSRARGIGAWADILSIVATLSVITNSCILAFTTDIIPRLVYYYGYSADYGTGSPTMHGYTEDSLSIFKISDFKEQNHPNILPAWFDPAIHTTCRYPGYRYPPDHPQAYSITKQYWKVLMAKLAFVIVMQHVVLLTKACIAYIIPDTPSHVRACMRRERFVVQTMLQQAELGRLRNTLLTDAPSSPPSPQFHVENEQAGMGLRRCPLHAESPGVSHPPQRCHMENDQVKKTGDDSLLKGSVEESSSEVSSTVFYSV